MECHGDGEPEKLLQLQAVVECLRAPEHGTIINVVAQRLSQLTEQNIGAVLDAVELIQADPKLQHVPLLTAVLRARVHKLDIDVELRCISSVAASATRLLQLQDELVRRMQDMLLGRV